MLRPAADGEQTDVVVLSLVASRLSNRGVATALLSDKTVARHLGTVYAKTGASSRAAAPAYAYDQGLTGRWPPAHDHAGAAAVGPASDPPRKRGGVISAALTTRIGSQVTTPPWCARAQPQSVASVTVSDPGAIGRSGSLSYVAHGSWSNGRRSASRIAGPGEVPSSACRIRAQVAYWR